MNRTQTSRHVVLASVVMLVLWLCASVAHAQAPVPGQIPTPRFNHGNLQSADGSFTLSWSPHLSRNTYDFARLEERRVGGGPSQWVTLPVYEAQASIRVRTPGLRQYRISACKRSAQGINCGTPSAVVNVQVPASAIGNVPQPTVMPPAAGGIAPFSAGGPGALPPGNYGSQMAENNGWFFYWNNNLYRPINDPARSTRNELFLHWATYRHFPIAGSPNHNLQPVWLWGSLIAVEGTPSRFQGALWSFRLVNDQPVQEIVGEIKVDLSSAATPMITWQVNDPTYYHNGQISPVTDNLRLTFDLIGAANAPTLVDPWEGVWIPNSVASRDRFTWINTIRDKYEFGALFFFDPNGQPIWAFGKNNTSPATQPVAADSYFCMYVPQNAWYPNQARPAGLGPIQTVWLGNGCSDTSGPTTWNVRRSFGPMVAGPRQPGEIRVNVTVPPGVRGVQQQLMFAVNGGQEARAQKWIGQHDVRVRIGDQENPTQCNPTPLGCAVVLSYFSDGVFPDAKVYRREWNTQTGAWGEHVLIGGWVSPQQQYRDGVAHTITLPPGQSSARYRFELRKGAPVVGAVDTTANLLLAFSPDLTVTASAELPPAALADPQLAPNAASARVGATRGEFRVSESGAATYSIPIMTVPGTGGMAPEIALAYSSQQGEGPLGLGWSISGQSAITRCSSSVESGDGNSQPVRLQSTDRFCLDGQRLMLRPNTGAYGAAGSEYRTEIDQLTRVTAFGTSGTGPHYFLVERKDGSRAIYGADGTAPLQSASVLVPSSPTVFAWPLARVEDAAGNYMLYEYQHATGDFIDYRLSAVRYTGSQTHAPYARISFAYEALPAQEQRDGYLAGVRMRQQHRLLEVQSLGQGNTLIRRYPISYGNDGVFELTAPLSGRSTIEAIHECHGPTAATCLPATSFTYNKGATTVGAVASLFGGSTIEYDVTQTLPMDLNGDGRQDIVLVSGKDDAPARLKALIAQPDGSLAQSTSVTVACEVKTLRLGSVVALDLEATGFNSLVYAVGDCGTAGARGIYRHRITGNTLGPPERIGEFPSQLSAANGPTLTAIDVTGDGYSDLVLQTSGIYDLVTLWNPESAPTANWIYVNQARSVPSAPLASPAQIRAGFSWITIGAQLCGGGLRTQYAFNVEPLPVGAFAVDNSAQPAISAATSIDMWCSPLTPGGESKETIHYGPSYPGLSPSLGQPVQTLVPENLLLRIVNTGGLWRFEPYAKLTYPFSQGSFRTSTHIPADVNGDGLTDIVAIEQPIPPDSETRACANGDNCRIAVQINNGSGGGWATTLKPPELHLLTIHKDVAAHARLLDYDGDGAADLLVPSSHSDDFAFWRVHPWQWTHGTGTFSSTWVSGPRVGNVIGGWRSVFYDRTGNGWHDYLLLERTSQTSDPNPVKALGADGRSSDCAGICYRQLHAIRRIEDGLGAWTEIDYGSLAQRSVYTRDASGPYPAQGAGSAVYDLIGPNWVVREARSLSPQAVLENAIRDVIFQPNGVARTSYYYTGAKVQTGGRGYLGFREVASFDPQSGMLTRTEYSQQYPFVGTPLVTETSFKPEAPFPLTDLAGPISHTPGGSNTAIQSGIVLSHSTNTTNQIVSSGGRPLPYISRTEIATYHPIYGVSGAITGRRYSHRLITTQQGVDGFGNFGLIEQVVDVGEPGAPITASTRRSSQITSSSFSNNITTWRVGRLLCTTVTSSRPTAPGVPDTVTRRSSFGYNAQGFLERETVQPASCTDLTDFETSTVYTLDRFGNRLTTTQTARDAPPLRPRRNVSTYDPLGRYVDVEDVEIHGILEETSRVLARDRYGNPTQVRNGKGLVELRYFDAMGRPFYSYTQDGNWKSVQYRAGGDTHCPAHTAMVEDHASANGSVANVCKDALGRSIRSVTRTLANAAIYQDTWFDFASRPVAVSEPYQPVPGAAQHWTRTGYDELGRVEFVRAPNDALIETRRESVAGTEGLVVTTIDPFGRSTRDELNVLGEVVRSEAPDTGVTEHRYDAIGQLVATDGPLPGPSDTVYVTYTAVGHKASVSDPDKGLWQYRYDGFGNVLCAMGPGAAVHYQYDQLGRLGYRVDRTGVTNINTCGGSPESPAVDRAVQFSWWHDDSGDSGFGDLVFTEQLSSLPEGTHLHEEEYFYDNLGRRTRTETRLLDPSHGWQYFNQFWTYDQIGRVFQAFDASGSNRGIRYLYTREFTTGLREAAQGASGTMYWSLLATNARGQATHARLGNGYDVNATYNERTGRVETLTDSLGSTVPMQIALRWDEIGRLRCRQDSAPAPGVPPGTRRSEKFEYDARDRLTHVFDQQGIECSNTTATGWLRQAMSYDVSGNIQSKSDIGGTGGAYIYGSARPHAVTRAGNIDLSYDARGNVIADSDGIRPRSLTYSSRDQLLRVETSDSITSFAYGIGDQRTWRRDANSKGVVQSQTRYIGSVEIVDALSGREFRRMIGGSAIATWNATTATQTVSYLHKDHLGSTVAITNATGGIVTQMSYDPWGKRRNTAQWHPWQAPPGLGAMLAITPRGYTGHEHVDTAGIVHMNGRIYDPHIARFLQADPFVEDSSTLNRYTYVHNNPLALTDPTGYMSVGQFFRTALAIAISVYTGGMLQGASWALINAQAWSVGAKIALAMAGGAISGAIQSGTIEGAAWGALSGAVFLGIGEGIAKAGWAQGNFMGTNLSRAGFAVKTVSHGLAGGTISRLQGGKFGHGFASAAGSAATSGLIDTATQSGVWKGAVIASLVGGAVGKAVGGNFANGALTAAMSFAFNQVASSADAGDKILTSDEEQIVIDAGKSLLKMPGEKESWLSINHDGERTNATNDGCTPYGCSISVDFDETRVIVHSHPTIQGANSQIPREFPGPGDHLPVVEHGIINAFVTPSGAIRAIELRGGKPVLRTLSGGNMKLNNFVEQRWEPGMSTSKINQVSKFYKD